MLQTILLIVVSFIVFVLLIAALMKKNYSLHSEILINRPKTDVFNYIKFITNQRFYSKWIMEDPNVELISKGTDGTVGYISSWKSKNKNVGEGEQEITQIFEGEGYNAEVRFEKPFKGVSQAEARVAEVAPGQSKYSNTFHTRTPFPMNIMIPLITKMLQKDMDETSARLKRNLENQ